MKNNKKTKKRTLPILVLSLIILICIFAAITLSSKVEDEEEIVVSSLDRSDIVAFSYEFNGEVVDFIKDGDIWKLTGDESIPINQQDLRSMVYSASKVVAERLVDNSNEKYHSFGLDNPVITIWLVDKNKKITTYLINPYNKEDALYYFSVLEDESVYLVRSTLYMWFSKGISDLIEMDPFPEPDMDEIDHFSIHSDNRLLEMSRDKDTDWYTKTSDDKLIKTDGSLTGKLLSDITTLTPEACENYKADESELGGYGLDQPASIIKVDSKEPYTLYVGNRNNRGDYYVMQSNMKTIYSVKSNKIERIINASYEDVLPKRINQTEISDVGKLSIEHDGKKTVVDINVSADGKMNYTIGNKAMNEEDFKEIYTAISNLSMQKWVDDIAPLDSTPVLKIEIYNRLAGETQMINIHPYDLNFYRIELNGVSNILCGKNEVMNILDLI